MVRIFSYVINFVRFRESQTAVIDEHFNKAETTKARIEALYVENQDVDMHVAEMRRSRQAIEAEVKDKMRRNDELKTRLLELRKGQDRITDRLERVKAEKTRVTELLEDTTAAALAVKQDSSKLRPYVLQSPAALQSSLVDLSSSVQAERGRTEALDRRARALQTSADTFGAVAADVASCIRLLEEVCSELQKEDDEAMRAARHRDALSERGNNVREVERTELMRSTRVVEPFHVFPDSSSCCCYYSPDADHLPSPTQFSPLLPRRAGPVPGHASSSSEPTSFSSSYRWAQSSSPRPACPSSPGTSPSTTECWPSSVWAEVRAEPLTQTPGTSTVRQARCSSNWTRRLRHSGFLSPALARAAFAS